MSIRYKAIVSSDWNECLAPSGPFDFITFNYPQLETKLFNIFRQYTGNRISLAAAVRQIEQMLPHTIKAEQVDAYLAETFTTYTGVPDLIEWCSSKDILFMINTTGMIGYFQRVFAGGFLPRVPVISAHPMLRYPASRSDPGSIYDLFEIRDKVKNSQAVIHALGIPSAKIILMGDSGGDGPHFAWGSQSGAYLIGNMTKPSLDAYCRKENIKIDMRFGVDYSMDDARDIQKEMRVNFMDLAATIDEIVNK